MKKFRIFSILILSFVLGLLFINRDKLVSFALEDNINMLKTYDVIKNNTSFLFEDYVQYGNYEDSCVILRYHDEWYENIANDYICTFYSDFSKRVVIENDYADYWIIDSIYQESGGISYSLFPYEYDVPEYYLECSPEKITLDTYATCKVFAKTYYSIDKIEFDLALDDFIIYDEVKLEDVEELTKNEHHYVLSPKYIEAPSTISTYIPSDPFDSPVTIYLMEFKIKTEKDQDVDISENVKLVNLEYDDIVGTTPYEIITSTVGQEKIKEVISDIKEEKPNPNTVDTILMVVVLFVISATVLLIFKTRKKIY